MSAILIGSNGPVYGDPIKLDKPEVSIGRTALNTVSIPHRSVSREHCRITAAPGGAYEIHDLDSYNGTFVNGLRVKTQSLHDGDEITVGDVSFIFRLSERAAVSASIRQVDREPSESRTVVAPHVPLARETAAVLRVGEIARAAQDLYLERGAMRPEVERRLCAPICDLIPSRRAAIVLFEGDDPVPFAGYDATAPGSSIPIPHNAIRDVLETRSPRTGLNGSTDWLASPLSVAQRLVGVLYVDSGNARRNYLEGDFQMITALSEVLGLAIENARDLRSLQFENGRLRAETTAQTLMIGDSAGMAALYESIAKVARGSSTVLISGESGTGKELVARAIHRNSSRAARPFVAINCAAIAETLLESEFFGHEKGAFTGAYAQRKGKLELADGGTAFLDEIGELAPALQAKLLRVLQEHEFERVGGSRTVRVDIRVVAATNRDLDQAVREGSFREDLFYRLNVVPLRVPPLRQRRDDIPLLANWFVRKFSEGIGRPVSGISREARAMLVAYDWPGNVRELQNIIERAVVMGSSDVITPEDLSDLLPDTEQETSEGPEGFHEVVRQTRKRLIAGALERSGGNVPEAARLLHLHPNYLHRLITNLGLRQLTTGAT